jgi:hypothetical protein
MIVTPCERTAAPKPSYQEHKSFQRESYVHGISTLHGMHHPVLIGTEHQRSKTRVGGSHNVFPEILSVVQTLSGDAHE